MPARTTPRGPALAGPVTRGEAAKRRADEARACRELDKQLAAIDDVRVRVIRDRKADLTTPWPLFIRRMRCLSSQAWGSRIEARLRVHHGWAKVAASLARGDAQTEDGFKELKTSIITRTNAVANFVQIRPHHDISGYHLFVVETDYTVVHMALSCEQMREELAVLGSLAHGTAGQNTNADQHAEFAIRIRWEDGNPVRERFRNYEVSRGAPGAICCGRGAAAPAKR